MCLQWTAHNSAAMHQLKLHGNCAAKMMTDIALAYLPPTWHSADVLAPIRLNLLSAAMPSTTCDAVQCTTIFLL